MMEQRISKQDSPSVNRRTALGLILRAPDSYGLVLALLIASFILAPFAEGSNWLWLRVLVQGATMLFALYTSRVRRRTMQIAFVLFVIAMVVSVVAVLFDSTNQTQGSIEVLLAVLLAVSVPAILRRILTAGNAGLEVVLGALAAYIMFGLFFSAVYAAIGDLSSTPFFNGNQKLDAGSYQFFSFVTLTTVGYGNLVPATSVGQSLAVMEALLGQIYLVTLVGRLVSNFQFGSRRRDLERLAAERQQRGKPHSDHSDNHEDPPLERPQP